MNFKVDDDKVSIKVYARVRPLNSIETGLVTIGKVWEAVKVDSNSVQVQDISNRLNFSFDYVFGPEISQVSVFETVAEPMIKNIYQGYNATIFSYGATGSGKTHTMMGDLNNELNRGIIPRSADLLCNIPSQVLLNPFMTCSSLEIYKEKLIDLTSPSNSQLKIKETPCQGLCIENLNKIPFSSKDELINIFKLSDSQRTVAATKLNKQSSRSHFLLLIDFVADTQSGAKVKGKLNLIDLAGSEKVLKSEVSGKNFEEAKKINLSLTVLSKVIFALSSNAKHVPYRDSKLTRLLQDSLGGNCMTALIVNCSTISHSIDETTSTLRFAQRAKTIKNTIKANKEFSVETELKSVKQELTKTKRELARMRNLSVGSITTNDTEITIKDLSYQILQNEKEISDLEFQNKDLQTSYKSIKDRYQSIWVSWKLLNLKSKNEKEITSHLELKSKKLKNLNNKILKNTSLSKECKDNTIVLTELNINNIDKDIKETEYIIDINDFYRNLEVSYIKSEQIERNVRKVIKMMNWKVLHAHGLNKIISEECMAQQTQLKNLETLIDQLRKFHKLIKDSCGQKNFEYATLNTKWLEASLEVLKTQAKYWETCIEAQTNSQKYSQKISKDFQAQTKDQNVLSNTNNSLNAPAHPSALSDIQSITAEIAKTSNLLLSWMKAVKKTQDDLGISSKSVENEMKTIQNIINSNIHN
jgi:Kinesin motor domain